MAGPTPVSALMHAATMVTAGIYLMARMFPLYQNLAQDARGIMIAIGAITLFGMGLLALVANDIKKVLAFSTVSQLGYMMTAIAAGGYTAGVFHLFTHAYFKALLFLGAGSVIHAVHSNNMSDMGGLRKYMPTTYWTWIVGALALTGIGLSGFWSKDEILVALGDSGATAVLWIAVAGAFVTAFYMARATALTFHGKYKGHGEPHESPRIMTVPLVLLAIPSALIGVFNIPGFNLPRINNFTEWLSVRVVPMGDHHPEGIDFALAGIGLAAAVLGVVVGWMIFSKDRDTQEARDTFEIPILYPILRRGYWVDDLAYGIVGATKGPIARFVDWTNTYILDAIVNGVAFVVMKLGGFVYGTVDQKGVDGVVHGLSAAADGAGSALRKMQTGRVQQYAASFVGGALILVVVFVFLI
jgi:NADH-quinone oxidoreductase subunit L